MRRRWSLKGRERMGFGAFEKMKCIFSIAPVGSLEKSRECFLLTNTHRTQCTEAPDAFGAMSVSDQRVQSAPDALHQT